MTVSVTVHDGMSNLRPNGVDSGHLRCDLGKDLGKFAAERELMA